MKSHWDFSKKFEVCDGKKLKKTTSEISCVGVQGGFGFSSHLSPRDRAFLKLLVALLFFPLQWPKNDAHLGWNFLSGSFLLRSRLWVEPSKSAYSFHTYKTFASRKINYINFLQLIFGRYSMKILLRDWKNVKFFSFKSVKITAIRFVTISCSFSLSLSLSLSIPHIFFVKFPFLAFSNENFNHPPCRSELVFDWLKFTRTWIKTLRRLVSFSHIHYGVCVCVCMRVWVSGCDFCVVGGVNRKDPQLLCRFQSLKRWYYDSSRFLNNCLRQVMNNKTPTVKWFLPSVEVDIFTQHQIR